MLPMSLDISRQATRSSAKSDPPSNLMRASRLYFRSTAPRRADAPPIILTEPIEEPISRVAFQIFEHLDGRQRCVAVGKYKNNDIGRGIPANDTGAEDEKLSTSDPDRVRAALRPLIKLLARRAARDWLRKAANDNVATTTEEMPEGEG